jgi:phosphoribosylanthranilate isomerase
VSVAVKICGLTRLADALEAARLGADALGFNFWPSSKRYCEPARARAIIERLPPFVTPVGVFVNASLAEVRRVSRVSGITRVQLHGDETADFSARVELPVIKAVRVEGARSLRGLSRFPAVALLLDSASAGFGGSGKAFDWGLVRSGALKKPVLLAGGLTPANVAQAVRRVEPYAVDVASGVESSPGVKDWKQMARFIAAAREA